MATEIKESMEGKWIVYKNENFDKYLDALGVGTVKKKIATSVNPKLKISVNDDVIKASLSVGPKKNKTVFKLGEEFAAELNDIPSTGISTWQDGVLKTVITPKDPNKKVQIVEREIVAGEMIQTMTVENVTARRFFKKCSSVGKH